MDRTLLAEGLANARDLGGLPRRDGSATPYGVFFRSESVDHLTSKGWDQVHGAGIRSVVDLRQDEERRRDRSPRPVWLTSAHVDHDGLENQDFWKDYWDTGLVATAMYYLPHLAAMPERTAAAVSAVLNAPEGGVLFHCMGGRDRTGLISLLLLTAASVQPEAIVDDYLETVRRGEARAAAAGRTNNEAEIEEFCRSHGTSTEGAFREAQAGLDLTGLLDASGLSDSDRSRLFNWRGTLT